MTLVLWREAPTSKPLSGKCQSERTPYSPHRAEGGGEGMGGVGMGEEGRGGEAVEREVLLAHHLLVHEQTFIPAPLSLIISVM